MDKFRYLTSEDHARWYVKDPSAGLEIPSGWLDLTSGLRVEIREWVENNCQGPVYVWNKTRTPVKGEPNWANMVMPQGDIVVSFTNEHDRVLFSLTWA